MLNPEIGGLFGCGDYAPETPRADPSPDQAYDGTAGANTEDTELLRALLEERHRPGELDLPSNQHENA